MKDEHIYCTIKLYCKSDINYAIFNSFICSVLFYLLRFIICEEDFLVLCNMWWFKYSNCTACWLINIKFDRM